MLIENVDYYIRIIDMPCGVHGCVAQNEDGTHSVYLNARDSRDRQCAHETERSMK